MARAVQVQCPMLGPVSSADPLPGLRGSEGAAQSDEAILHSLAPQEVGGRRPTRRSCVVAPNLIGVEGTVHVGAMKALSASQTTAGRPRLARGSQRRHPPRGEGGRLRARRTADRRHRPAGASLAGDGEELEPREYVQLSVDQGPASSTRRCAPGAPGCSVPTRSGHAFVNTHDIGPTTEFSGLEIVTRRTDSESTPGAANAGGNKQRENEWRDD